jgi:hypothetical protein
LDQEKFDDGDIAGWQLVEGPLSRPVMIPRCPVPIESAMYMIGFARGVRDARERANESIAFRLSR